MASTRARKPRVPHITSLFLRSLFFIEFSSLWATVSSLSILQLWYLCHPFCLCFLLAPSYYVLDCSILRSKFAHSRTFAFLPQ